MAHPQTVTPHRLQMEFEVVPPEVYFFKDPIRGRPMFPPNNYTLVDPPAGIPTYAISTIQDWYRTSEPDVYLIPLWLNISELFTSEFDTYFTVTEVERLRADLIAYRFYTQVDYFWIILLANNILDPFHVEVNTILRIPATSVVLSKWLVRPVSRIRG